MKKGREGWISPGVWIVPQLLYAMLLIDLAAVTSIDHYIYESASSPSIQGMYRYIDNIYKSEIFFVVQRTL